jgi:integrase
MATKTKARPLTARGIEALQSDPVARREIPDGGAGGLYLVIQPSGAKSWAVRYRHDGKPRKMTLGAWPATGLADARRAAERALDAVAKGDDPAADAIEAKRAAKAEADPERDLVRTIAADYLARHAMKKRSGAEVRRILDKDVLPVWGARRIDTITKRDVIELLDTITDRGSPIMANRVLAHVRAMFNWAVARDVLAVSPCAGVKPPGQARSRDRVLSDDELRLFWAAAGDVGPPWTGLLRLLLLTGQRREEVGEMTVAEMAGDVWTIPAARAKNGAPHAVPLSDAAGAVLAAHPRIKSRRGFVFTTTGDSPVSGYSKVKARLDGQMLARAQQEAVGRGADPAAVTIAHWTLHDLRRTAASGMARLGVNLPVIERVLNHVSGSFGGVAGVYNRHSYADEMRRALDLWAAHVLAVVEGRCGDNVVTLRAAQ